MSNLIKFSSGDKVIISGYTKFASDAVAPQFIQSLCSYESAATITDMQISFSSSADVNIVNNLGSLNQTITSGQPFNIAL